MESRWIDRMGIGLDRAADVPVGVQLTWALGGAIRAGTLGPGDRFPPLRELADELGVNANTLRTVYARLEAEGLIETRHGSGTFVAATPPAVELSRLVATSARAAREAGLEPRDLAAALYVAPAGEPDADGARRRALREEIAVLERVLTQLPQRVVAPVRSEGPRLLGVTELETARDELVARIGAATRPEITPAEPAAKTVPKRAQRAKPRPRLGPATA